MFLTGRVTEAFHLFYAEDVIMQGNSDAPRVGKAVNRQADLDFFGSVKELHGAEILSSFSLRNPGQRAVRGDISFCEITMDITFQND